ncbi:MAG: hypothetical protein F2667_04130, partial [Actinobacteria bacterium]|nr:hypothetical protein [Actinomycetota bacterium]
MGDVPQDDPSASGGDLFDRWLAHREQSTDDETERPRTFGIARLSGDRGEDGDDHEDSEEPPGAPLFAEEQARIDEPGVAERAVEERPAVG